MPFVLLIPKSLPSEAPALVGRFRPNYISAATKSVAVAVTNGSTQQTFDFNVTPSSPDCASGANGLTCTESILAPVGNDEITLTAFDGTLSAAGVPQGSQLSSGSASATIAMGQSNTVAMTLDGVPASVVMSLAQPFTQGTTQTVAATVSVYDADNYAIVGGYSTPLQIPCFTQTLYDLTVTIDNGSSSWITSSSDQVSMTYTGSGIQSVALQACEVGSGTVLGSITIAPSATFGTETAVGTSLANATAYSDYNGEWFTEPTKSRIANLAQGGSQPAYYPVPSGAQPLRLLPRNGATTVFTLSDNAIGLMNDQNGSILEYPLLTSNAGLYGLGGWWSYDFSIWFTENSAGKVGELETVGASFGTIVEYPTGFAGTAPAGMAQGPNGFVFADPGANAIGVCNPGTGGAPAITEVQLPTPNAMPLEITSSDSNERVWFTEKAASKIGSMDASGRITEYASAGVPVAIALQDNVVFVLTATGDLEQYDINSGAATTIVPPTSSNGPVVAIGDGGYDVLELLRGNGSMGSVQPYYF
ncbi:MAG TPA: hypothetical protein VMG98_02675 [Verrucomicrobiae bacterium]|nr:hypothetical protein [Verrucomicrobiae bacterium]